MGDRFIRAAPPAISRGVVVCQDAGRGVAQERGFERLPGVDWSRVEETNANSVDCYEAVSCVQQQCYDVLAVAVPEDRPSDDIRHAHNSHATGPRGLPPPLGGGGLPVAEDRQERL